MTAAPDEPWALAVAAARALRPAEAWRLGIAGPVRRAAEARVCGVVTCSLEGGTSMRCGIDPPEAAGPFEEAGAWFLSDLLEEGWDWRGPQGEDHVFAPLRAGAALDAFRRLERQAIAPLGLRGAITAHLVSRSGRLLGWIAVAFEQPEDAVYPVVAPQLHRVAVAATATLEDALDLASGVGATVAPRSPSPALEGLTRREREIAWMVAGGLSDLNVAERLRISEATVGTHLHRIYRKLGVHSRVQLARRVMGGPR